jgi:hypothetical protein
MKHSVTLYRAVILQLFIDGVSTNTTRHENVVAKLQARSFVIREKEDFIELCNLAEISHEQTKKKFLEILKLNKTNRIVFLDFESIILYPEPRIERK